MERLLEGFIYQKQTTLVTTHRRLPMLIEAAEAAGGIYRTKTISPNREKPERIHFHYIGDLKELRNKISELDKEARKRNTRRPLE